MKKTIRHITVFLLSVVVLIASTGISACCLFGCHSQEVRMGKADCCQKTACSTTEGQPEKDCDGCQSTYISLDADWLTSSFESGFSALFHAVSNYMPRLVSVVVPKKIQLPWLHDLPPPPYGKLLLPHIQSFLC